MKFKIKEAARELTSDFSAASDSMFRSTWAGIGSALSEQVQEIAFKEKMNASLLEAKNDLKQVVALIEAEEKEEEIATLEKREQELSKFIRETPFTMDKQFASLRLRACEMEQQVQQLNALKKEIQASMTTKNNDSNCKCLRPLRPDSRTKSDLQAGKKPFLV